MGNKNLSVEEKRERKNRKFRAVKKRKSKVNSTTVCGFRAR